MKNKKTIAFFGTMNAMPMMYALELRKKGYDVTYIVDRPKDELLSRPEYHYPEINYPYPEWIVEIPTFPPVLYGIFPRFFSVLLKSLLKLKLGKKIDYFILNGFFISFSQYMTNSVTLGLSHGSDLTEWAKRDNEVLFNSFINKSIFKFIPKYLSSKIIKLIVKNQYEGFSSCDAIINFAKGVNVEGDKLISEFESMGIKYIPRYDISFAPLVGQSREFKQNLDKLVIFSGVRFSYKTFTSSSEGRNKGNDLIIQGIAEYIKRNKNVEIHFVEKGLDVELAKKLCTELDLDSYIVWHKEMELTKLLELYQKSDICFDQVGDHWISAIGGYSLWLGKPLIANCNTLTEREIWPEHNPVLNASTKSQIFERLVQLENIECRRKISIESKIFAEKYLSPEKTINEIDEFIKTRS